MQDNTVSPNRLELARKRAREYTALVVNRWLTGSLDNEPKFIDDQSNVYRMSAPYSGEEFNKVSTRTLGKELSVNRAELNLRLTSDEGNGEVWFLANGFPGGQVTILHRGSTYTSQGTANFSTGDTMLDWLVLTTLEALHTELESK